MTAQAKALPSVLWSEESEQIVLGGMMLDQALAHDLYDIVAPEQFFSDTNRAIARTITILLERGIPADPGAVFNALGTAADGSTAPYLHTCFASVPHPASARHHARIVAERAHRRRTWASATAVREALERGEDAAPALETLRAADSAGEGEASGFVDARTFLFRTEDPPRALWGSGQEILWARGEPLFITGGTSVGKTTLAQQLVLSRIGLGPKQLLDLDVEPDTRPVLYLAIDRPRQAKVSLRRMVCEDDHGDALAQGLVFWPKPLPFDVATEPSRLARWIKPGGFGTVVVDSLKDIAFDLSKDEPAGRVIQAFAHCLADDIEILVLHHRRKFTQERSAAKGGIDDVFGSQLFTAGAGSVVHLDGAAGSLVVRLRHLKPPAAEVGPFEIEIHPTLGRVQRSGGERDELAILREAPRGLTLADIARARWVVEEPDRSQRRRVRDRLDREEAAGQIHRVPGGRSALGTQEPDRWFATRQEALSP